MRWAGGLCRGGQYVRTSTTTPGRTTASSQIPDGELVDVTPVFSLTIADRVVIEWPNHTEFVRDEAATFTDRGLPTRSVPTRPGNDIGKACEFMTVAEEHLRNDDLEKCRYWMGRANRFG